MIGIQGDYAWANAEGRHDSAREIGVAYHSKVKSLAAFSRRSCSVSRWAWAARGLPSADYE